MDEMGVAHFKALPNMPFKSSLKPKMEHVTALLLYHVGPPTRK
jgi:hypothetical protein